MFYPKSGEIILLRIVKILLILSVALWGFLGLFHNLIDWGGSIGAVNATTSMATVEGGTGHWKATTNPAVIFAGAFFIGFFKLIVTLTCFGGAWRMWKSHGCDAATFATAKTLALTGCGVALFMLFTGWIVIADTWFELWRSDVLSDAALGSAFRYGGLIGVIALFVGMHDE